jgi:ABC-2 type transport system permease protein
MKLILKYLTIWWLMSRNSFISDFNQKIALSIFLFGKIIRFIFFFAFIYFLLKGTNSLAGYNINQTLFFFLTFNLVDVLSQFMFREVYRFRPLIVSGDFDLVLTKPVSALFRVLMGGADVIDFITIPPLIAAVYYAGQLLNPTTTQVALFIILIVNGFLIATAFHIAVLSLGIITLEVDHTIMIYRDLVNLGRFPVDIYKQPLQGILTYLVPVGLMVTLPAKALMGLAQPSVAVFSFLLALLAIFVSLKFWNFALTKYTSASS